MKYISSNDAESAKLETIMGYIFAAGVIITFVLAVTSVVFLYHLHGPINLLEERGEFFHQQNFFALLSSLIHGSNIQNGTLLFASLVLVSLVLTPLLVVAVACIYFALRKRFKCMSITFIVIAILITSLALH